VDKYERHERNVRHSSASVIFIAILFGLIAAGLFESLIAGALVFLAICGSFISWANYRTGQIGAEMRAAIAAQEAEMHEAYLRAGLDEIDLMEGEEYEHYVAAQLRSAGWEATVTQASGDFGVDIVAQKGEERLAVQCKRYSKPVGLHAVGEVVAGANHYRCTRKAVVSNQGFTASAVRLAAANGCELVGRTDLADWLAGGVSGMRPGKPV